MPFMRIEGLGDVPEETVAPEGEYDLRIVKVVSTADDGSVLLNKAGDREMVRCHIRIEGGDDYQLLTHHMVFPKREDDQEKRKMMIRGIKRFLHAFGVEWGADGFDPEDLEGATAQKVRIRTVEYEGNLQNEIRLARIEE